jgi:signal peptidase I
MKGILGAEGGMAEETSTDATLASPEHPRKAWLAVLLGVMALGLGQLYCGRPRRALILVIGCCGVVGLLPLIAFFPPAAWLLTVYIVVGICHPLFWITTIVDAWRLARKSREGYTLRRSNRLACYAAWAVAVWLGGMGLSVSRSLLLKIYSIPTRSMRPTILQGDRIMVNHVAYRSTGPRRGDIVVFRHQMADGRETNFIQRVVAVGGDLVEATGGRLKINGKTLPRSAVPSGKLVPIGKQADGDVYYEANSEGRYMIMVVSPDSVARAGTEDAYPQWTPSNDASFAPVKVPPRHCFVVGDNRRLALDSRAFGAIPETALVGRADYVIWPAESWSRLGLIPVLEHPNPATTKK